MTFRPKSLFLAHISLSITAIRQVSTQVENLKYQNTKNKKPCLLKLKIKHIELYNKDFIIYEIT